MSAEQAIASFLKTLPSAAGATFLALFPIVNPLGGIPMFFTLTTGYPDKDRDKAALKTAFYVLAILAVFMMFGRFVLHFFGISLPVLNIAGGLIVANTAWGMVTSSSRVTVAESDEAMTKEDISLTPMAMPMLSGPGSIGVVMGLAAHADSMVSYFGMLIGIGLIALSVYLVIATRGPARQSAGPQRDGRNQSCFRVSDSRHRGATGVGWCGGVPVRKRNEIASD